MADSLKDQLIALGLAKAEHGKGKAKGGKSRRKLGRIASGGKPAGRLSLEAAYRLREQEEKRAVENKKRQKQEQDRQRRQINAEIHKIVNEFALNDAAAEVKRNFLYKGRIRSVLVTPEQLKALNAGELGVVFLRGGYHVMEPEQVARVRKISPDHIPDLGAAGPDEDTEHPVPDDLIW